MITKDNLIYMLEKSLTNEDEFVLAYGSDLMSKVEGVSDLDEVDRKTIKNTLSSLLEDTKRHAKLVRNMIDAVQKDGRNEF